MIYKIKKISWVIYPFSAFVLSFWSWRIFENNLFIFFISFILTILFFLTLLNHSTNTLVKIVFLITFVIMTFSVFPKHLDKSLWEKSVLDTMQINTRRSFYPFPFGVVFQNKYAESLNKYENNFSTLLDINFYFFASHPRERVGIEEFEKYSPLFLPFLIFGLIKVVKNKFTLISVLLILTVAAFIDSKYILGPVLVFPIFTAILAIGEKTIVSSIRH